MKKWPLIEKLALADGIEREAIRKWRERGRVALRHRNRLMEIAASRGERLEWRDFDEKAA